MRKNAPTNTAKSRKANKKKFKHPRIAKRNYSNGAKKGWETRRAKMYYPVEENAIEKVSFEDAKAALIKAAKNYYGIGSDLYDLLIAAIVFSRAVNGDE